MKRNQLLVSGLLITSLSLPFAQQAWGADRAKVAAIKKRAAKQAVPAPHPVSTPITDTAPEGLRLSLTTQLRNAPVTPVAAVAAMIPSTALPAAVEEPHALVPVVAVATPALPKATAPGYPPPSDLPPVYTPGPVPMIGGRGENPYLPRPQPRETGAERAVEPVAAAPKAASGGFFSGLIPSIPLLPDSGQSILPKISKVYPTGEKPLVVVSFKCPTEVVGITPPTIKLLHGAVDLGMAGINKTDLLSFDLQQVCQ